MRMIAFDLELTRAAAEVRELEERLRVVPLKDSVLAQALRKTLEAKRERLERLRSRHESGSLGSDD